MGYECKRPDAAAMEHILERAGHSPEGVILSLAWREGLSREEIAALTWPQVDLESGVLRLSDREVPLEPPVAVRLQKRHQLYHTRSDHVVISERYKKPMPPESISRLARLALDAGGVSVSLKDLRQDFVIRMLETRDWPYAARVSGMAVSTLRGAFSQYFRPREERKPAPAADPQEHEYLLWRILQQEGSSPVGLALWMSWKMQMQPKEIVALTWSQVDFDREVLHLSRGEVSMGSRLRRLLKGAFDARQDITQDRVFLTAGTGKPIDLARLSTITRTALIRGGLEDVSLGDLRRWTLRNDQRQKLLDHLRECGSLTREEAMELLGVSKNAALSQLNQLREEGAVTRVGIRYYPAETVTPPEDQTAAVLAYLKEYGSGCRRDFSELLGLSPTQTTQLLRRLTTAGEVLLVGKSYTLPPQNEEAHSAK